MARCLQKGAMWKLLATIIISSMKKNRPTFHLHCCSVMVMRWSKNLPPPFQDIRFIRHCTVLFSLPWVYPHFNSKMCTMSSAIRWWLIKQVIPPSSSLSQYSQGTLIITISITYLPHTVICDMSRCCLLGHWQPWLQKSLPCLSAHTITVETMVHGDHTRHQTRQPSECNVQQHRGNFYFLSNRVSACVSI